VAVLDTATLAEAALVLRKYSALCVNDTMFYVRWLPPPPLGLCKARVHGFHLPVTRARTIVWVLTSLIHLFPWPCYNSL